MDTLFSLALFQESSPYHLQLDGPAERFVDTLRWAIQKSREEKTEEILNGFLLMYQTTPNPSLNDETLVGQKLKMIRNALLQSVQTSLIPLYASTRLAADTAVYLRDHRPNET
ncbi:unnamed protein product [Hymenolepis diminuta]|uniref:Exportin(tRNA) n=1 Tax=Hymenolepis diminuta TaxID=6216 RepID=A0A0R3S7S3_HYMDI|nr:unnamed protein product [Hymenolepis diminuta]